MMHCQFSIYGKMWYEVMKKTERQINLSMCKRVLVDCFVLKTYKTKTFDKASRLRIRYFLHLK